MSHDRQRFPWGRMMHLGLGQLRLSPAEFWRSTPRELSASQGVSSPPLLRQKLFQLMELYPDDE